MREEVKANNVTRSRDTSTWLQADANTVDEVLETIQNRIDSTKNAHLKEKLEILKDKVEFQYVVAGRTDATTGTKVDDVYEVDGGYDVFYHRDKGDKSRVVHRDDARSKEVIERCLERARNNDKEILFQLKKSDGKLMSVTDSDKELSRLLSETVDIKKEVQVTPSRTNQMLKKEGKSSIEFTVEKRFTSHSLRKGGAMEREVIK